MKISTNSTKSCLGGAILVETKSYHQPVLLNECLEALQIRDCGTYVDATMGGGGHTRAILARLGPEGRLLAFDQDPDAAAQVPEDSRLVFIAENFRHLQRFLRLHDALPVQGILADLGVSSHQIDTPERGFSTRFDAPLDLRMDTRLGMPASAWIAGQREEDLADCFFHYGEIRNARKLARQVAEASSRSAMNTTADLVKVALPLCGNQRNRYLAQVFQALRIVINDELNALKDFLEQSAECLAPGGRLVVITYHSLEDRPVKQFMLNGRFESEPVKDVYGNPIRPLNPVLRKAIRASGEELARNPRARSARLRVAERLRSTV
jgi:16S rRNA (cytosine1402-N4)-methyltransferase